MLEGIAGKVALVTGAARPRGIGRATALRLAREGADIACIDLGAPMADFPSHAVAEPTDLETIVQEIESMGRRAVGIKADVTDEAQVEAAVAEATTTLGEISLVANVVGGGSFGMGMGPLTFLPADQFDKIVSLNLRSMFLVTKACAARMMAAGTKGAIVSVSSQAGKKGIPMLGAYCAAKSGIILLTQTWAIELGPAGITVNAVCPGTVDTDLLNKDGQIEAVLGGGPGGFQGWIDREIPLGRMQTADDVANAIAFLMSADGNYITGEALNTSGGQTMV
ncbi:MAG: meso-butanediol dehydrogenase / (S,S)-butanediol dehydrogenase / diacetyl reductase [Actinomycetota bacterium]|jgi:NAD(P)-dependent dehydrogenase (short-subunit alcohol dehydrogenase family)